LVGPANAGDPAGAGLVGVFGAGETGDAADAGEGEAAGGELETAAACRAGLALPAGEGLSSSFGARAPMFATSWPIRIFPRKTGRSKM
jgi:hypothetical protein